MGTNTTFLGLWREAVRSAAHALTRERMTSAERLWRAAFSATRRPEAFTEQLTLRYPGPSRILRLQLGTTAAAGLSRRDVLLFRGAVQCKIDVVGTTECDTNSEEEEQCVIIR